jgi:hypothetical protein
MEHNAERFTLNPKLQHLWCSWQTVHNSVQTHIGEAFKSRVLGSLPKDGWMARAKREGRTWKQQGKATRGPERAIREPSNPSLHSVIDTTSITTAWGRIRQDTLLYLHSDISRRSAWVFPNARSQRNERTCFGAWSLPPPPSQFPPYSLPCHGLRILTLPPAHSLPATHPHQGTIIGKRSSRHVSACSGWRWPSLLKLLWMKEAQRLVPVTQALKNACSVGSAWKVPPRDALWHGMCDPPQLCSIDDWTPERDLGHIYLFIYLKPLCLSLSSRKPVTLGRAVVAVTPRWKEVGSKAAWPDMGNHFHWEWTYCLSKGYSHRDGTADHITRSNNMKGQNLATVPHIHVFLSTRGKWETPATSEFPSYHLWGDGNRMGEAGREPFPNQYRPWAAATV